MKRSRLAFAVSSVVLVFAIPGNSCGPFFPDAVFVQNSMPDGPYAAYAKGEIGIPQPGYRVLDLVVAYDWLNGHGGADRLPGISPARRSLFTSSSF